VTFQDKGPDSEGETHQGTVAWPAAEKRESRERSSIRQSCAYGETSQELNLQSDTMQPPIHRSLLGKGEILGVGDTTISNSALRL
jgi:hypothetical protein